VCSVGAVVLYALCCGVIGQENVLYKIKCHHLHQILLVALFFIFLTTSIIGQEIFEKFAMKFFLYLAFMDPVLYLLVASLDGTEYQQD
jgi:hypothetical protein